MSKIYSKSARGNDTLSVQPDEKTEATIEQLKKDGHTDIKIEPSSEIKARLEYFRGEIEAERISYGEIAELASLAEYIEADDVVLLEWAGVPEFEEVEEMPPFEGTLERLNNLKIR